MAQIQFGVDRTNIQPGGCVTFQWNVEGVQAVYFFHDGQNWKDHGVTGHEQRQECPPQSTTYYLRVIKTDGTHEMPSIRIEVGSGVAVPNIKRFGLNPAGQIPAGTVPEGHVEGSGPSVPRAPPGEPEGAVGRSACRRRDSGLPQGRGPGDVPH